MASMDEQVLKITKEIVVKFIEAGRVSPASFQDTFKNVYDVVKQTVQDSKETPEPENDTKP
jgi:predicted transcriptional regulator